MEPVDRAANGGQRRLTLVGSSADAGRRLGFTSVGIWLAPADVPSLGGPGLGVSVRAHRPRLDTIFARLERGEGAILGRVRAPQGPAALGRRKIYLWEPRWHWPSCW